VRGRAASIARCAPARRNQQVTKSRRKAVQAANDVSDCFKRSGIKPLLQPFAGNCVSLKGMDLLGNLLDGDALLEV